MTKSFSLVFLIGRNFMINFGGYMKKLLLGSTALAICISGLASPAQAAASKDKMPSLRISGETKAVTHIFKNSKPRGEFGYGTLFAMEDSTVRFHVEDDFTFMGEKQKVDWLLGVTGDTNAPVAAEENRLRFRGNWGVLYFGTHQGAESIMARGAFAVMGATGGFDGNGMDTVIKPTGVLTGTDVIGATKYADKVTYITPRVFGVQLGASYTPNSEHKGEGSDGLPHYHSSTKSPKVPFDQSSWAGGINFLREFECGLSITLSATGILAHSNPGQRGGLDTSNLFNRTTTARVHDTKSYALGGVAEYFGFELGAEWIDNGNSRQVKNLAQITDPTLVGGFDAGEAFSIAAGYTFGANRLAAGYYGSERKYNGSKIHGNIYSVTYDRKLAPGLSLFAEGNLYNLHGTQQAANFQNAIQASAGTLSSKLDDGRKRNNAHAVLLGAKLKF